MSEVSEEEMNMGNDFERNMILHKCICSSAENLNLNTENTQEEQVANIPVKELCNSVSEFLGTQTDNRERTLALFRVACYPSHPACQTNLPTLALNTRNIEAFNSSIMPNFVATWDTKGPLRSSSIVRRNESFLFCDGAKRRRSLARRIGGHGNTYPSSLQVIDEAGGIQSGKYVHFGRIEEHRLMKAAFFNNIDLASELLGKGVNPNSSDHHGRTALHLAASKGYIDMVKILLQNKANPNAKDKVGNTPLHLAACTNDVDVVLILLKAGAKVTATDRAGKSPLQLAVSKLEMFKKTSSTFAYNLLKDQITKVVDMLLAALHNAQKEESAETELLRAFQNSLTITETEEQVSQQVDNLSNILEKMKDLDIHS